MADHEATKAAEPIWYPTNRVLRTLVQVVIPTFLAFNTAVPAIIGAFDGQVSPEVFAWLNGVAAIIAGVALVITRLMAVPFINTALTQLGLGSEPKSVVNERAAAQTSELQPAQFEPSTTDYRTEQDTK